MGLNIKKQRVHDLARSASERSGLSQTSVIEEALEMYLESMEATSGPAERRVRIDGLLADLDDRLSDADRRQLRDAELYDDSGLPA